MLRLASLSLLLNCMLPTDSKTISLNVTLLDATKRIRMDMVANAVDDMYFGCTTEMDQMLNTTYLQEIKQFQDEWNKAEPCTKRSLAKQESIDGALTKLHMHAICIYTSNYHEFYKKFNTAVLTKKEVYSTSFPYHSLHFLLTSAIQILKANQGCHETYRRTKDVYTGVVNQIIRFGFFASSSRKADMTTFGKETCFRIKTCLGVFLKHYPHLKMKEEEVLIPPYELFRITKIIKGKDARSEGLSDCKLVYFLESAGDLSYLNCKAAGRGQGFFFG